MVSRITLVPPARGHQRHQLGLQVGGEAREGLRLDGDGVDAGPVAGDADAGRRLGDLGAGLLQGSQCRLQQRAARADQLDIAAGRRHGERVGAGLDAVGEHGVRGAFQPVAPWMCRVDGADALDLGAHLDEALGDVADLRLAGGVLDHRLALGERGRHQHVVGGADRDLGEDDASALQAARCLGDHVAAVDVDLGAELLQRHQVQVDRARADGAAARQRHPRLPQRASSGPSTQKLARMRLTSS